MASTQPLSDRMLNFLDPFRIGRFLARRRTRLVLAWLLALTLGAFAFHFAWTWGDVPERRDGNWGHANIDFGGQWAMARMVVEGHGRHLYDRTYIRRVLEEHYPDSAGDPRDKETDVDKMLGWMIGPDDPSAPPVGGALYPPVHALLFAPLALLPPQPAYRVMQAFTLLLTFFCGWVVERLTDGRVWWPVAAALLMWFPGFGGALYLGQNSVVSLALLLVGWWQLARGRPVLGGVCWGFLAYKPVWAASFFLVPLVHPVADVLLRLGRPAPDERARLVAGRRRPAELTRRWKFAAAMLGTGIALGLLTVPVVGWQSWFDWLTVGRMASAKYAKDEVWILLSRDLFGIPRRWMLHFHDAEAIDADRPLPTQIGLALWLLVLAVTVWVVLRRRRDVPALSGPPAAFVLLGAWLLCYHFIYYDVMLAALPVCLLFTEPARYFRVRFVQPRIPGIVRRPSGWELRFWPKLAPPPDPRLMTYYQPSPGTPTPPAPLLPGGRAFRWVLNPFPPTLLLLLLVLPYAAAQFDPTYHFPPLETFCLLALWAWCGWQWLSSPPDGQTLPTPPAGRAGPDAVPAGGEHPGRAPAAASA